MMGFLKDHLDAADKAELLAAVQEYRDGLVPHIVPFTLLRHHLMKHPRGRLGAAPDLPQPVPERDAAPQPRLTVPREPAPRWCGLCIDPPVSVQWTNHRLVPEEPCAV